MVSSWPSDAQLHYEAMKIQMQKIQPLEIVLDGYDSHS